MTDLACPGCSDGRSQGHRWTLRWNDRDQVRCPIARRTFDLSVDLDQFTWLTIAGGTLQEDALREIVDAVADEAVGQRSRRTAFAAQLES